MLICAYLLRVTYCKKKLKRFRFLHLLPIPTLNADQVCKDMKDQFIVGSEGY